MDPTKTNRFSAPIQHEVEAEFPHPAPRFTSVSIGIMALGILLGCVALGLVSNRFGNTDVYGLLLLPVAGAIFGFGCAINRNSIPLAILIGTAFGIASPILLFVSFWVCLIVFAIFKAALGL